MNKQVKRELQKKRLIVILDEANLELVKVNNKYELLNEYDHPSKVKKGTRCMPTITHRCLLALMDSPLNQSSFLQVYLRTQRNIVIEINPACRIPRTYDRFAGLMAQLLKKEEVVAAEGGTTLLKVHKKTLTDILPKKSRKLVLSSTSKKCVKVTELIPTEEEPVVIVIGAMIEGLIKAPYADEEVSISCRELQSEEVCNILCMEFRKSWVIEDNVETLDVN